eukprot:6231389-Pyramimonas_sp.AAC.1
MTLDRKGLLLIVAGSPCTNLSSAGQFGGLDGLAGPRSVNFFAAPLAWARARRLRPDFRIVVLVEDFAASAQASY